MRNKKIFVTALILTGAIAGLSYTFASDSSARLSYAFASDGSITDTATNTSGQYGFSGKTLKININEQIVQMTDEQKAQMEEIRTILTKQRAGETLTEEETAKLETLKPFNSRFNTHFGDKNITKFTQKLGNTEAMKSMTDEEKQAYLIELKAKFEELRAKQEVKETVIDKLLIGEALTSDEESLRQEIIKDRTDRKNKLQK